MPYRSYPHRGDADTARMRDFLVAVRAAHGPSCWHVGDLVWRLFLQSLGAGVPETFRLWDGPDNQLLGWASLTPSRSRSTVASLELVVHPAHRGRGLEDEMLDWCEAQFAGRTEGGRLYVEPGVYDDDPAQIEALLGRDFRPTAGDGLLLMRPLDGPLPAPHLPPGFTLRAVLDDEEAPARAAAHRDAFESRRVTDDAYRRLMRTPGYCPDLDIVAVAPDGSHAAFCLGWLDAENRVTEFEPVGTRPAYRQMGLGRAVLLEALARMQALGAAHATVGPVEAEEEAIVRLYHSVGFQPVHWLYCYVKEY